MKSHRSPFSVLPSPLRSLSVAVLLAGALSSTASAAPVTGSYTFTGSAGNVASFAYNGNPTPDITVSNLTKVGVTSASSSGSFGARSWTLGATHFEDSFTGGIDTNRYFEFSLTAAEGMTLELTSLDFGLRRDGTGTRQFEWRSSANGFSSAISTYLAVSAGLTEVEGIITAPDSSTGYSGTSLDLSGDEFAGFNSITFRFYAYNAESSNGIGAFSGSLSFTGEAVTAVPEPSTYALIIIGGLAALIVARRRRALANS